MKRIQKKECTMNKEYNPFENHTIITKTWTYYMSKIFGMIIPRLLGAILNMILVLMEIPAGIIWLISLGHINFCKVFAHLMQKIDSWIFEDI